MAQEDVVAQRDGVRQGDRVAQEDVVAQRGGMAQGIGGHTKMGWLKEIE